MPLKVAWGVRYCQHRGGITGGGEAYHISFQHSKCLRAQVVGRVVVFWEVSDQVRCMRGDIPIPMGRLCIRVDIPIPMVTLCIRVNIPIPMGPLIPFLHFGQTESVDGVLHQRSYKIVPA